ncbi:MAG TPA: GspMb/PilO family protein, partial [Candidatus Methylacidiphilales bacterium]
MSAPTHKKGLSPAERQKLYGFLAIVFLIGNAFAFGFFQDQFTETARNVRKLRADLAYDKVWTADRDLWTRRGAWIAKTQPKLADLGSDPAQGSARLLESLQAAAKKNNLAIVSQTLQDPRGTPFYKEVSVQLVLNGSLESLCRWLVEVEQPELFQAVGR